MADRSGAALAVRGGARRPYGWLVFLGGGLLLVTLHQLVPAGAARDVIYVGVGVLGTVGVLVGIRLHQPQRRRAWFALAASQLAWVLADLVGTVQDAVAPTDAFPTAADVLYLAGYPLLGLCLFLLTKGRRPRRDVEGALDSLTVAVGLYLLCWVLLARPTLDESADSWLAAAVAAAYPLLDITIIAMLVALIITPGTHTAALRMIVIAIGLVIIADTAATALGLLSLGSTGPIDFIWLLSYLLIGAAALHPSMRTLSAVAPPGRPVFSRRRQISTAAAVLVAPGTLAVQHLLDVPPDIWAVVIASVVMFLLVVARMNVAIHQIGTADRRRDEAQAELAHQAAHDSLTGLPNRAQSLELLEGTLSRAQRSGAMIGLLFVDLDGFKAVNDTFGHSAGDDVLRTVGRRMQTVVRGGDVVGRLGGDEFVVLLEPVVDEESAVAVGERLIAEVSAPIRLSNGEDVTVGASVGVAISQDARTDADALLVEADTAAYRAKNRGRGRTEVFDAGLRRELQTRVDLEKGLRSALWQNQLQLRFQPVMDLTTRRPLGWEAVLHWSRPGVGVVAVPDFRPVAETTDLIFDLDAWALRRAALQIAEWEAAGFGGVRLSVRVSVRHLGRSRVLDDVRTALQASGTPAQQLMVQVSDLQLVDDPVVLDNLAQLRAGGTGISLDDFGAGHSSVRRLARLPIDAVKLDGTLLDHSSKAAEGLLELMVRGVQNFGLMTAVKGVRTEEDVDLLRRLGCGLGQGELFGGLVTDSEVLRQLAEAAVHS
ncbi:diguanylate cyclase (GGDEF) domain-containing protein [Friedmanniella luteola]|uniref:Diguanylate cyclase (GGDEF) domain-containing protein n=1 Tax=Friedmanniella luteola TaxID=546871 RepID=A0A1H1M687_9ACTN|nr:EAL domain-containing protein [Friedmanniella luteola]SDR81549.1 diguanylate cyclase (GGDEF) domain-containing protein [Friedmanniella luteola]